MPRPWSILLTCASLLWVTRLAHRLRSGLPSPLSVRDLAAMLGLPDLQPPPTPPGQILDAILSGDAGFFCLLLAMAALAVEATLPRRWGW